MRKPRGEQMGSASESNPANSILSDGRPQGQFFQPAEQLDLALPGLVDLRTDLCRAHRNGMVQPMICKIRARHSENTPSGRGSNSIRARPNAWRFCNRVSLRDALRIRLLPDGGRNARPEPRREGPDSRRAPGLLS